MTIGGVWQLLAGLGIFLYGIVQLEEALNKIAGRAFKLFLRRHTDKKLSALFSGAIVSAVLQSGSVIKFIILSFVGSGVISIRNALAVVLGSNLGSTLSGWLVAAVGFKFNIEALSFPFIGLAGVGLIFFSENEKIRQIAKFLMGQGLLFLGLWFMQDSIYSLVHNFDFTPYLHFNRFFFVVLGFIITVLIQSSTATMVIALSALNARLIPFEVAVTIIIGSELGATIKIILGTIRGVVAKKQVVFGDFIFNMTITAFAFIFTSPLILLVRKIVGTDEPLIGLALFQSIINLMGIILFYPFLNIISNFLQMHIIERKINTTYFIQNASPKDPEAVLEALEKEVLLFICRVIRLNLDAFKLGHVQIEFTPSIRDFVIDNNYLSMTYDEKYNLVKHVEGEILLLYTKTSEEKIEKMDLSRLNQLISAVKNAMYSSKSIKDIRHDRYDLKESAVDDMFEHYQFLQTQLRYFYEQVSTFFAHAEKQQNCYDDLLQLMNQIQKDYDVSMQQIYKKSGNGTLNNLEISTLLNMSREIYSSNKAIIYAFKAFFLNPILAEKFENIPAAVK